MQWHEVESEFAVALRDPARSVPATVGKTNRAPSLRRFNVYRNNIAVSLIEALGDGYPVVKQLVGDQFFDAMAQAYASANAPKSAVMLEYGADFADFIAGFEPADGLPFLGDVARVEWAWNVAYHAADCEPANISVLQDIAPDRLETVRFRLHPSLQLITSTWPAVSIWHAHQTSDNPASAMQQLAPEAEHAIIVRPAWDVDVRLISKAASSFFAALLKGQSLGEATECLAETDAAEAGNMLHLLFATGSVIGLAAHQMT